MERPEVIISNGDGLQSTRTLSERITAVCYIEISKKKRGSGFYSKISLDGSSSEVGLFTNNHVLGTPFEAENAHAIFGYEDSNGGKKVKLRPELIFRTHKELDYTFVGIDKHDIEELQIQPIVMEPEPVLRKDDGVTIFQHPRGLPKKYSLDKILHVERPFVYYKADTETGSSGAPVLTSVGLKLVAIHHKGSKEQGYNKGTLCSEVLRHLTSGTYTQPSGGYSDSQDKEIFEDEPPAKRKKIEICKKRPSEDELGDLSKEIEICKNRPSEDELGDLSKDIVPFWKYLGRKLKLPNGSIEEIQSDNIQFPGVKEKAFQMLMVWVDQQGESASFNQLSRALIALGKNRLAQKYCSGL